MGDQKGPKRLPVKISDEVLKGVYANSLMVMHARGEFVLDFLSVFPPQASVNARVIVKPDSLKRMLRAVKENLDKYESRFGEIVLPEGDSEGEPEFS